MSVDYAACREFWTGLIQLAGSRRPHPHPHLQARTSHFLTVEKPRSNLEFNYTIKSHRCTVELVIKSRTTESMVLYDAIANSKASIEQRLGFPFNITLLQNGAGYRCECNVCNAGYLDRDQWPIMQRLMLDSMTQLKASVARFL